MVAAIRAACVGVVRAIATDVNGKPVNTIDTVKPPGASSAVYKGFVGVAAVTGAWASAAFAREYSTNGAISATTAGTAITGATRSMP